MYDGLALELIKKAKEEKATYLDLGNCGLTDLNEIPELFECTSLETLILSNEWWEFENGKWVKKKSQNKGSANIIKALSPHFKNLKNLNKLVYVRSWNYKWQMTDYFFLSDLKNLTNLSLSSNQITDISFLSDLKNLTDLDLSDNQITDISFLFDLKNMTHLDLSDNRITDYSFLSDLKNLTNLDLRSNEITDISFLSNLKNLTHLDLSYNHITDYSFLSDLKNLTVLSLRSSHIMDYSFLSDLKNLTHLSLNSNQITDISFLSDLKNLTDLSLSSNQITDYSFLSDLKSLTDLDLRSNHITDISFLSDLKNLTDLDLSSNQITDISFLSDLKNLTDLDLSSNQITDISFLSDLKSLTNLDLRSNHITDISFLSDLKNLTDLDLSSNHITDISFLSNLKNLTDLDLSSNHITDISFLSDLKNLTDLDLSSNHIMDISFLSDLKNLTDLNLSNNQITDISFLPNLKNLTNLNLRSNQITDYSFLSDLKNLTVLSLRSNKVIDYSFLSDLKNLTDLDLSSNQITDISFLSDLKNLTDLDLSSNQIMDISFLSDLKNLTDLYLSSNQITDISFLSDLKNLTDLNLSDNQVTDISFLSDLRNLTDLYLSDNQVTDISFLSDLRNLTFLDLSDNQITDISFLSDLKNLTGLGLNNNPIPYTPKEVYQSNDCIEELRAYWAELEASQKVYNNQLKIMFLGNGCAGKTTLLHWFIDNEFKDIDLKNRTEGIIIKPLPLCENKILGNFWDFGGQEIYHATHRLFLGRRTLYILVWATETPENKIEQRYPPQYWLDMIADIADKHERSRVLIVQNLFDNQFEQNFLTQEERAEYTSRGLDIKTMSVNAKTGDDIDTFKVSVESNAKKLFETYQEELPETWVNIRTAVAEKRENKEKVLSWSDFEQICQDCQLQKSTPSVVIGYLHRAGEVYYYKNQFDNQIILDQEWALKAVYAVLKKESIDIYKGIFKLKYLLNIWREENPDLTHEDAQIFLNFMLSNQIMFYTKEDRQRNGEAEFVIPQLLPSDIDDSIEALKGASDNLIHQIEYAFLHRDIIERFIVKTAQFSEKKQYWRNGVYIKYDNARAIVEVIDDKQAQKKKIHIECFGNSKESLSQKIREEFNKIRSLEKAKEFRLVNGMEVPFNAKVEKKESNKQEGLTNDLDEKRKSNEIEKLLIQTLEKMLDKNNINELKAINSMKTAPLKDYLQELIGNAKIEAAIDTFLQWTKDNNESDLENNLILLKSRFSGLKREITQGLLDKNEADRSTARITHSLNSYIDEAPRNAIINTISTPQPQPAPKTNLQRTVFISYNHKDSSAANKVKQYLESKNIKVTMDTQNMNAGEDIKAFIEKSVRENEVTLSIVSSNSLMSAWVAMESVNTFYAQKVTDKKFIAAFIDSSFFKRSFVDDALDNIEIEINDIQDTIKKRMEKGRSIEDLQNELTRYKTLHNNLPSIVQRLKESLSIDISDDKFDGGMVKIIDTING